MEDNQLLNIIMKAKYAAFKRALEMARTASSESIRKFYNISKQDIDKQLQYSKVDYDESTAEILMKQKGAGIGLKLFKAIEVRAGTNVKIKRNRKTVSSVARSGNRYKEAAGVLAQVRKDKPFHRFGSKENKAFIQQMKSGHIGVWVRTGSKTRNGKERIIELFGPSVPQLLSNDNQTARKALESTFFDAFDQRFEHEINRRLG